MSLQADLDRQRIQQLATAAAQNGETDVLAVAEAALHGDASAIASALGLWVDFMDAQRVSAQTTLANVAQVVYTQSSDPLEALELIRGLLEGKQVHRDVRTGEIATVSKGLSLMREVERKVALRRLEEMANAAAEAGDPDTVDLVTAALGGDREAFATALSTWATWVERAALDHSRRFDAVRALIDGAKDGTASAWLTAFADIRDLFYPDSEAAKIRRQEQAKRAAGKEWRGV